MQRYIKIFHGRHAAWHVNIVFTHIYIYIYTRFLFIIYICLFIYIDVSISVVEQEGSEPLNIQHGLKLGHDTYKLYLYKNDILYIPEL